MTDQEETLTFNATQLHGGRRLSFWLTVVGAVLLAVGLGTIGGAFGLSAAAVMIGAMTVGSGVTGLVILSKD